MIQIATCLSMHLYFLGVTFSDFDSYKLQFPLAPGESFVFEDAFFSIQISSALCSDIMYVITKLTSWESEFRMVSSESIFSIPIKVS